MDTDILGPDVLINSMVKFLFCCYDIKVAQITHGGPFRWP